MIALIGVELDLNIARYYEQKGDFLNAGEYYSVCEQYAKALQFFMQCSDEKALEKAIVVVRSNHF